MCQQTWHEYFTSIKLNKFPSSHTSKLEILMTIYDLSLIEEAEPKNWTYSSKY